MSVERAWVRDGLGSTGSGSSGEVTEARVLVLGQGLVAVGVEMLSTIDLGHDALQLILVVHAWRWANLQVLHNR